MDNEQRTPVPGQQPPVPPQVQQPVQPVPQYQQPVPQIPLRYQPPYRQPVRQPNKKTAVWKILVPVIAGVLALAVLAGVYFLSLRPAPATKITLSGDAVYLRPGDAFELSATIEPAADDRLWTSSDRNVATVENGVITAVGEGRCTVTLSADGGEAACQVRVETPPAEIADVAGTWRFNGAFVNDVTYNVGEADVLLTLYADHSGVIAIGGERTKLAWSFSKREDGQDHYTLRAEDGTVCTFIYYGDITLYGAGSNSINFQR